MVGPADPKVLTARERFHQYLLNTIGPVPLLGEAVASGINQWNRTPEEWGQGWNAYGKRFLNNLGYNAVRQTTAYGMAEVFHEDSRYFQSHAHGFWPRTRHALAGTFTGRHPDGSREFSVSSVTGVLAASAAQSAWGPPSVRTLRSMGANAGISFATTAAMNIVREFLPDILHRHD